MTINNGLPPVNEALGLPDPRQPWSNIGFPDRAYMGMHALQGYHEQWVAHNFPDQADWVALGGMSEEIGELWHAFIKHHQGIRDYSAEKLEAKIKDALGDIMIYMMHFANTQGVSIDECLRETLAGVWKRDWIAYPSTGRPPEVDEDDDEPTVDMGQGGNAPRFQ